MLSILDEKYKFWKENLECNGVIKGLPIDKCSESRAYEEIEFEYDTDDVVQILQLTGNSRKAVFVLLLSSVYIVFSKYSWDKNIRIGIPREGICKDYLGVLPLNYQMNKEETIQQIVNGIQKKYIMLYKNQDVNEQDIQFYSDISFETETIVRMKGVHSEETNDKAKLELCFLVDAQSISCKLRYDKNVYFETKINRFVKQLKRVLPMMLKCRSTKLTDLVVETEESVNINEVQFGEKFSFKEDNIVHRLKEMCVKAPNEIAVVDFEKSITYEMLWKQSSKAVHCLRDYNVKKGDVVGIQLAAVTDFIVMMVAIMRLGAVYVPMDENVPFGRVEYYLQNSGAKYLISNAKEHEYSVPIISINDIKKYNEDEYTETRISMNDPLYILYTSGSTGEPKGAVLSQLNLINLVYSINNRLNPDGKGHLNIGQLTSFSFDPSECAIMLSLYCGYTLYIVPTELHLDGHRLIQYIQEVQFDYIVCATAHINVLIDGNIDKITGLKAKVLNIGGEQFKKERAIEFSRMFSEKTPTIWNTYGLTETSVLSTIHEFDIQRIDEELTIPIGRPIYNTNIYILDEYKNRVPYGGKGEIYIGGMGVGKGYVNNAEETEKRFVEDPFGNQNRMYRTGDMGRWSETGELLFEGRIDSQLKIRGYRIEIEGIEQVLCKQKKVKDCAVVVKTIKDDKQLIAYLELEDDDTSIEGIQEQLRKVLPGYMIPSYFVVMKQLPRNINNKIDKNILKNMELQKKERKVPFTETQEKLLLIWKRLLNIDNISIDDDFFMIGGQSLKIVKMISMIFEEFHCELSIVEIMQNSTIELLATVIDKCDNTEKIEIKKITEKDSYSLSPAQKRMFIVHKLDNGGTTYNTPMLLEMDGYVEASKLEMAIEKIIDRHEILRTIFVNTQNEIVQKVLDKTPYHLEIEIVSGDVMNSCKKSIQPFVLEQGPLLRTKLFVIDKNKQYLFIDMHHIISDMITVDLFLTEIFELYQGKKLPDVSYQFKDYSDWINKRIEVGELDEQRKYWLSEFQNGIPELHLLKDYNSNETNDRQGKMIRLLSDQKLYYDIKTIANRMGVTMQMVMVSAYAIVLSKYTNDQSIVIGLPIAARKSVKLDGIMGPLLNTVLLCIEVNGEQKYHDYLMNVKQKVINTLDNQEYPLDLMIDEIAKQQTVSRGKIYDVSFNYYEEGSIGGKIEIEGVDVTPVDIDFNVSHASIDTTCSMENDRFKLMINFLSNQYDESTMEYFGLHYFELLKSIVENPDKTVEELNMYTQEEVEMFGSDEYA